jgi:DNA excision repair protein ERCC-2
MPTDSLLKISVRNLVEFVLRSGDLDSSFTAGDRGLEGTRLHQKIQKSYPEGYTPEVTLSYLVETPELSLDVGGRADGIFSEGTNVILDEIKTTTRDLDEIDETAHPLYWAQAKCYAFIYASQNQLESITVQLTYCQVETQELKMFRRACSPAELKDFFDDLVDRYLAWARKIRDWIRLRNQSIKAVKFPFGEYRKGQREMAVAVYRTLATGKNLFAQAPTGIGKTMATLFPAIKGMGEGKIEKIFYLTARTTARELAVSAAARLREKGLAFKTLTLTAKEKICFQDKADCRPEVCPFAKGHFDRVNGALDDIFQHDAFNRPVIEEFARKHRVCPFEFSLDLSLYADAVIGDYNYVFDPKVYLRRFFMDGGGEYCFLVDEAHNLVDRAREMFSAEFSKQTVLDLKRTLGKKLPQVTRSLTKVNTVMLDLRRQCEEAEYGKSVKGVKGAKGKDGENVLVQKTGCRDLVLSLRRFNKAAEAFLARNEPAPFRDELLELYFQAMDFIRASEFYDSRYVTYVETVGRDVRVKLFCLDPSYLLREALERGKSAIFFSATLTPIEYFKKILGGEESDYTIRISSPFPAENLLLMIADNIRTTYRARLHTYDQIVEVISAAVGRKPGNYLVYLPSYKYQQEIAERFATRNPDVKVLRQTSGMSEPEREAFLTRFDEDNPGTLVGFAVMGGVFGEGIDLVGERLSGCIVVGVGLPQICLERDLIRDYFAETAGLGFEYAYTYPGMNKVLQAAGRVIRTETDRGFVLLIDHRFATGDYLNLFPSHWRHGRFVRTPQQIEELLRDFWQSGETGHE